MTKWRHLVGILAAVATPAVAHAQGLEVDHKAVGCIVAGKYPKMNACFTPAGSLARGRVYFRPEGTPSWYYVEMKTDQPCYTGILPKPSKKLVGKKIEYYVEGQDRTFNASRTAEYGPVVVKSAAECKKTVPIAPFLNNATVAVFPSLPAGFAAGAAVGTVTAVAVAGAGIAAGTAAVVAASGGNNNTTTTTPSNSNSNTTTTVAAATTTTTSTSTTTTVATSTNHPPLAVLKTSPDPPQGVGPLTVTFDMCGSSDPDGDALSFFFNFGDGAQTSGACLQSHTYPASSSLRGASDRPRVLDTSYTFEGSVTDGRGGSQSRTRTVVVQAPAPSPSPSPSPSCAPPPAPTFLAPANGSCNSTGSVTVNVQATDPQGVASVIVKAAHSGNATAPPLSACSPSGPVIEDVQTATGTPPVFTATLTLSGPPSFGAPKCYTIGAIVTNKCGQTSNGSISLVYASQCYPYIATREVKTFTWSSDLAVEGGRMQVVMNGTVASFPGRGRAYGMGSLVEGENRVEATLVESAGNAGLWRFDFADSHSAVAGSIRVVAGEVVAVAATSITFRLTGTPGERIVFTFGRQ